MIRLDKSDNIHVSCIFAAFDDNSKTKIKSVTGFSASHKSVTIVYRTLEGILHSRIKDLTNHSKDVISSGVSCDVDDLLLRQMENENSPSLPALPAWSRSHFSNESVFCQIKLLLMIRDNPVLTDN